MVTYVVTVMAKKGHEQEVTKFYQDQEPLLRQAKGYHGRQLLRARPGTMEAEIRRVIPADELKGAPREEHEGGVHFVMIEKWDSVSDRIAFSRTISGARSKDLFPHLLPAHSHEFYEDVTPAA